MARRPGEKRAAASAPAGFDRLLEHRLRLTILVLLARFERLSFSRLKEATAETDGNLGANLRKLEDGGYLDVTKAFVERRPVSWYELTPRGRDALQAHLASLEALIAQARGEPGEV